MSSIHFKPFKQQQQFLLDKNRIKGAFAGKRGGKTEVGAIQAIMYQNAKINYRENDIDPFIGLVISPTNDMLRRLSMRKLRAYARPFEKNYNKTYQELTWNDDSIIYGLSADRPERIEGIKAHWVWLDEVFQMTEQLFLETRARTSDTQGNIICTGSLGTQYINPKLHWAYQYFKASPDKNTSCYEWSTSDNPYFPADEIENLRESLDPTTFRAMFELNWDITPKMAVYHDFDESNIIDSYTYNSKLTTYVSIDWGYAHPMAAGFFQYDHINDVVYQFDEIIRSRMTIDKLYNAIIAKPYNIRHWCCDIAGNQEREQTGRSNVIWFSDKGIRFKYRSTAINYGIPIVRSYVLDGKGRRKFLISRNCKKSIDGMKQYRYPDKDGIVQNENPIKKDDDAVDMIRYFFVNYLDKNILTGPSITMIPR